jgi:hypothetical protein
VTGGGELTSAFSLLGNETRLRIVLELGDASGPGGVDSIGFSDLQSRVGIGDNGNFNYHLRRLTGTFVERGDDGYRLMLPGVYVYRALKTGPLGERIDRDRLETDVPCPGCEGSQEVGVEDGRGVLGCRDCGILTYRYPLPAGGLTRTDGTGLARALRERAVNDTGAMLRGFCPYCSGTVDADVGGDVASLPASNGRGRVGERDAFAVSFACEHCRWFVRVNTAGMLDSHPRVSAFLYEHGIDSYRRDPWCEAAFTVDVRSEDPWTAHVHVAAGGETLSIELDERLDARELERELTPMAVRNHGGGGEEANGGGPGVTGRGWGI